MAKERKKIRLELMAHIYQHLLLKRDILSFPEDNPEVSEDEFYTCIVGLIRLKEKEYITQINKNLSKWTFDRLGKVEQAIFLLACAELDGGLNERAVVINEAVKLAKNYCDADSYKLINAALDKI